MMKRLALAVLLLSLAAAGAAMADAVLINAAGATFPIRFIQNGLTFTTTRIKAFRSTTHR